MKWRVRVLLGLKTDNPVAQLCLYDSSGRLIFEESWLAERQLAKHLLGKVEEFLHKNNTSLPGLTGLFVFEGPGSFTGLRIGITVMNTLSYSLGVPIVAGSGDDWRKRAVSRLINGENDGIVLPFYGADARITSPKK